MTEKSKFPGVNRQAKSRVAEQARMKMNALRYITRIHSSMDELATIAEDASKRKQGYTAKQVSTLNLRITALDKSADIAFKALRKLVPDLRPEEIDEEGKGNGEGASTHLIKQARDTLADRLSKITAEAGVVEGAEQTH